MVKTEETRYLIIGNSAGGIGAAEAIREVDKTGGLTIISDEPYTVYSRPLISEHLADGRPLERMLYRQPDFYEKNKIIAILGQRVTALDVYNHVIKLEDGRTISWGKLLLATGGSPIIPEIKGAGLKGVFTFTTLDDAKAIGGFLNQHGRGARAVVIGGGLIGVSATEALVKRKVEVTIVEMKERILNTILDEETSSLMEVALKCHGAEIITGHNVSEISSFLPGKATGVILDDGRQIPCEIVIVAVGVQPRLELVNGSGIKTSQGIVVDRRMATSHTDIYACGDVAEAYDFVYEQNRPTPVWPNANAGGRIAGLNMAGAIAEHYGGTAMNTIKYFGVNIVSAGMVTTPDDSYETIANKTGNIYKRVLLKDGLIAGMVFASDIEMSGIVYNLMKDRLDVSSFKEALVADDFRLASLPEHIWRPMLAIPRWATSAQVTSDKKSEEALVSE